MINRRDIGSAKASYALAISVVIVCIGVVCLTISQTPMIKTLSAIAILLAWMLPIVFLVRYRSALKLIRSALKTEELKLSEKSVIAAIEGSRTKASRHEYHQEQALSRIETELRRLSVLSNGLQDPISTPASLDVLFVTSNGAGLGHVSRLLAIAENLPANCEFELLTLSRAYKQVARPGLTVHYFPSSEAAQEMPERWNRVFQNYFKALLIRRKARVVVFDGTWVYRGITEVCRAFDIPLVWVQRGMWKREVDRASVQRHSAVSVADHLIIPGDFADSEVVDAGRGIDPHYVGPIVRTSYDDLLSRVEACSQLGLDPNKKYVLLNLGGGSTGEVEQIARTVLNYIDQFSPELYPVQVISPLSSKIEEQPGVLRVSAYPVMKYAAAFEYMVAAAGYNSAQESVSLGMPSILIPNSKTKTDDQVRRALRLAERGLCVTAENDSNLSVAVEQMSDLSFRNEMRNRAGNLPTPRGAAEAANVLKTIIDEAQWQNHADTIVGTRSIDG